MTKHAMECWEAQELLEGIAIGAISADDALAAEAQRHLSQCAACRKTMTDRRTWNARLTNAMANVAIPDGLETRLTERLGPIIPSAVSVSAPQPSRRKWMASLAVVASLVLVAFVWQPWQPSSSLITVAMVDANIASDLTDLTPYSVPPWSPVLPLVWRSFFQLEADLIHHFPAGSPRALFVAALVPFEFKGSQAPPLLRGRLVIVPVSHFRDAPGEGDFSTVSDVEYIPGFSRCVWREGNWVYICYVRSVGGAELRELQRLMRESRNFT